MQGKREKERDSQMQRERDIKREIDYGRSCKTSVPEDIGGRNIIVQEYTRDYTRGKKMQNLAFVLSPISEMYCPQGK